ncbi:dolichyl-diphosphooligosaccharide--protein glycotransferase subunit [Kluyveromyces lactis]|uniref:Dolichyl-diphosphooligosaccharide-protein glycosyltransferase subunit OST5 n=1 Tax=Kluyveromyces lactis (strain ATCC 8585 / CBS 2359 / DSM 70799 / NBRC 1267 / NRRL Y-1140 / WM37) TaxID=284590 RepID=Q6CYD5_KLULA|nr:uncharacterized protein KLLA0_A01287g [Kluyveromyces lactis]CAH02642.2 KLLA0A01287p [Kluyveromyces lactis]|eukprot:XP_451054.2 uncharacterized protein KLLA0_A01287g [Kluyveromyces lactis]
MSYETLFKLHKSSAQFQSLVPLEKQPYFAAISLLLAIAFISPLLLSSALPEEYEEKNKVKPFSVYELLKVIMLGGIGSLFFGISIVFLTNSFGVYV